MRDWYFNNKQNTHDERGYRTMSWTSWPDEYEKIVNRIENDKYNRRPWMNSTWPKRHTNG
jgi:hypothetical protein